MKTRLAARSIYLAGPALVLAVAALAVLAAQPVPAGIPVTAAVELHTASLPGLLASLCGALVMGGSLWWLGRKS